MTRPTTVLPQLDGTRANTNARLAAWLHDGVSEEIEYAIDTAQGSLEELQELACTERDAAFQELVDEEYRRAGAALTTIENLLAAS